MILDNKQSDLLEAKEEGEAMTILSSYLENITNKDSTMPHIAHTAAMCSSLSEKKEVRREDQMDLLSDKLKLEMQIDYVNQ